MVWAEKNVFKINSGDDDDDDESLDITHGYPSHSDTEVSERSNRLVRF